MTINILKKPRKKKTKKSTFHLFHYFYLVAIGAIVIILIVAGLGLRHILRDFAIHAAEHTAIHISSALSDNQIEPLVSSRRNERLPLSVSQEELPKLDRAMRKFLLSFEVVKVKIYDAEKRIIYSTDSKIIGNIDSDNDMLATALNGTAISKYEREDTLWDLEGEQRYNVQIVETYVPIHSSDGKIIGSFEIYKDITDHLSMMQKHLIFAWTTLCITVLVVFATLMIIINRASKAINSRTNELMATNKELEQEIINCKQVEKEKEQVQSQLRQTQKLEAIGTLASGIAHDFNNILTAMVGYADLALDDIQEEKTITRTNLEQVLIAGNRAKELVKQILTFSRKTDQEQKPIEIASIVKEALKMLRSSMSTTIEIRQNIEADSSVIMANPTQIHQVLVNLCTNAVHAMSDKNGLL